MATRATATILVFMVLHPERRKLGMVYIHSYNFFLIRIKLDE